MSSEPSEIRIHYSDAANAWSEYRTRVMDLIYAGNIRTIAEIGAGANPLLNQQFLHSSGTAYHLFDESKEELEKAGEGYSAHVADFEEPLPDYGIRADLIIIQMTLEHIRQPEIFFRNVLSLLNEGGKACLFFACPTNLPMLANRILPEWLSHRMLLFFQPFRRNEKHGKFRAYYRWCYGPTKANLKRLRSAGFGIGEYVGYYGHNYYAKIPFLHRLEQRKTRFMLAHPNPHFCTYAQVTIFKPVADSPARSIQSP